MRLGIAALAASIVVAGCSAGASQTKARIDATTLPGGWRVDCNDDHAKAQRTCFAATFANGVPFQVAYVNGEGPMIITLDDFPGRVGSARIDGGAVIPLSNGKAVAEAMTKGRTAHVVHHVWPDGERRFTLPLSGFGEAYAVLQTKL